MSAFKDSSAGPAKRHLKVAAPDPDGSTASAGPLNDHGSTSIQEREVALRERVRTTAVAWYGHADLTRREWESYGSRLGAVTKASSWWLGDWVRFGQRHYNDHRFEHASRITGYDEQTVRNFAYVAGRCEFSRRRENLSWSHHAEVAALTPAEQDRWLEQALTQSLSVRQLRQGLQYERRTRNEAGGMSTARSSDQDGCLDDVVPIVCEHCGETTRVLVSTIFRTS